MSCGFDGLTPGPRPVVVPSEGDGVWRGRTTRDKADEYQRYLLQNGIAPLEAKGAVGVQMLRTIARPKPNS